MTNYTEVFSGNMAKASVFDNLCWRLYLRHSCHTLFPVYRTRVVYEHWTFFSAHTENGKLAEREEIFTEFDKKCIGLES